MKKTPKRFVRQFHEDYDAIRTFILVLDLNGTVRNINKKGCDILGITKKDAIGKDWFKNFIPDPVSGLLRDLYTKAITVDKKLDESFENTVLCKGRKQKNILWHASFVKDRRKIVGLLCSGEDVSRQRLSEEKLRESETNYRALVDNIHQAAFNVDFKKNLDKTYPSFVSECVLEITGFTAEEFRKGKVVFDRQIHPDDQPKVRELFWKMFNERTRVTRLYRFRHKNGSYRWFEDSLAPKINDKNQVTGCYGVLDEVTESKEVKAAIHDYETFFSLSTDMFCIAGVDGYFKKINPSFERILGYSSLDLLNKPFLEFIHPNDVERTRNELVRLSQGNTTVSFENRYRCKDGSFKWLSWNSSAANKDGLVYAAARDISKQKAFEEKIRKDDAFLNSIVENIPNMIFVKDARDLKFVRFNKAGEDLLGLSRDELIGKSDFDFFPKKEADFFTGKDRQVLEGKKLVDIPEESIHTKYKGSRRLHTRKIPIYDESGNPEYLLGISEDITEAREAQEALRKSEEKYRDIVHLIQEGIWIIDKDDKTTFVNEAMAKMLNYKADEMLGKPLSLFMDAEGKRISKENSERRKKGLSEELDYKFKTKDGQDRWAILNSRPLHDAKGNYAGAIAAVVDVTERRKNEELIRENEQRLSETQKMARIGGWEFDVAADRIRWSDETFRLFGLVPEKRLISREEYRSRIHPEDRDTIINMVAAAIQHGTPFETEMRVVWDDGSIHYLYGRCKPVIRGGKVIKLLGTGMDVTEQKMAELREMRALVEGQDMERRRIAHDLHDSLGQKISAIKVFLENSSAEQPAPGFAGTKKLGSMLNETIAELRYISHNLMPAALDDFGLVNALHDLCNRSGRSNGTLINFQSFDVSDSPGKSVELGIYRIAQELLNNSLKHSWAKEVNVQLFERDNSLVLTLEDDGIGFDRQKVNFEKSFGLNSIATRAKALNGLFNLDSRPGKGVVASVEIPLKK